MAAAAGKTRGLASRRAYPSHAATSAARIASFRSRPAQRARIRGALAREEALVGARPPGFGHRVDGAAQMHQSPASLTPYPL